MHDFAIEPRKAKSRTAEVRSDTTGSDDARQEVRWRLSRAALTKAIDWELTYTVTRLKNETDVTHECDATVTTED